MRGFMNVTGFSVELPKRATTKSAGYDFKAIEDFIVNPSSVVVAKTGIKAYMGDDEVLEIYPRSSMGIKKNVILANSVGIIDSDYFNNEANEGHIMIALYNYGNEAVSINKGDKIAQGIFKKYLVAENDATTHERKGGIGSTGEK